MTEPRKASSPHTVPHHEADRPSRGSIVVLDPDAVTAAQVEHALEDASFHVVRAASIDGLMRHMHSGAVDVLVVDETVAVDGDLLEELKKHSDAPAAVVLSGLGTVEGAVDAMRHGASHYAAKPIEPEEVVLAVDKAVHEHRMRRENRVLRDQLARRASLGALVVHDPKMREVFSLVETVAQTRATILLLGESGTGKSVLARAIHAASPRAGGPFVEVNCGALPENLLESELFGHAKGAFTGALRDRAGRFESAHGGTIFLDEIGTASQSLQVRLLRVLQERVVERVGEQRSRAVDVRVILATNLNLEAEVRAGRFREDLYYRIHVVAIELPPLRDRRSDIPELARTFLAASTRSLGRTMGDIAQPAMDLLLRHPWPGNVRELENAIEHAVATGRGPTLEAHDLPSEVQRGPAAPSAATAPAPASPSTTLDDVELGTLDSMLAVCERRFLERALAASGQCRTRAAALLGLHRATLYQRMKRVGLNPADRA